MDISGNKVQFQQGDNGERVFNTLVEKYMGDDARIDGFEAGNYHRGVESMVEAGVDGSINAGFADNTGNSKLEDEWILD